MTGTKNLVPIKNGAEKVDRKYGTRGDSCRAGLGANLTASELGIGILSIAR